MRLLLLAGLSLGFLTATAGSWPAGAAEATATAAPAAAARQATPARTDARETGAPVAHSDAQADRVKAGGQRVTTLSPSL